MPIGIDSQLKSIPDAELRIDRRQVVAHGGFADAQTIGNRLILETLADHPDELTLTCRQCSDLELFWVGGLVGPRAGHLGQHTGQQKAIRSYLAGMDFDDGFEEDLCRSFLTHQAHGAQADGVVMHVHVAYAGEHDDMCFRRGDISLWQQVKAIRPSEVEVQQDDVRMLKDSDRECIFRPGALAHQRNAGLTIEEHP
jgi:hypothetical protein